MLLINNSCILLRRVCVRAVRQKTSDGHSFSKRIINMWNSLLDCIVLSKSVDTFRMHVNKDAFFRLLL